MTQDLLDEATRALSDLGTEPAPDASATRARVLSELRGRRRRRVERRLVFIPAAAILLLGTAAAAATGSLSRAWEWVESAVVPKEPAVVEASAPTEKAPPSGAAGAAFPAAAAETEKEAAPAEEDSDESGGEEVTAPVPMTTSAAARTAPSPAKTIPAPRVVAPTQAATAPRVASAPKGTQVAPTRPAPVDPSEELYRKAHRAHFAARDYARALGAWDEYLKAAPRGRFALEARYNRAICMLRLGNTAGARTALRPFADGKFGEYRREEATQLLRALDRKSPAPAE